MSDRIPLGVLTGSANNYEGVEHPIGTTGAVASLLANVFLACLNESDEPDDLTAQIVGRDSGDVELWTEGPLTLPWGELGAMNAISPAREVAPATQLFLEVIDGGTTCTELQGWYELAARAGVPAALGLLTTQARVLEFLSQPATADGDLLDSLIAAVSERMQRHMGREIGSTVYTDERHSASGVRDVVQLRHWPLVGAPTVVVSGEAVDAADLDYEADTAWLYNGEPGSPRAWPAGRRHIAVSYTAGWATIPEDLVAAATTQVVWEYKTTGAKGDRLRERQTVIDDVNTTYMVDAWEPSVLATMAHYRRRELARSA